MKWDCVRENLLLQAPQAPLQSSLGFHFSLWDTAPESHYGGWKSNFQAKFINSKFVPLCPCASIDLYYKGLFFPSNTYLATQCLERHIPFFPRLWFVGKTNSSLLVLPHLPDFLSLIPPPSPVLHLPIFWDWTPCRVLGTLCSSVWTPCLQQGCVPETILQPCEPQLFTTHSFEIWSFSGSGSDDRSSLHQTLKSQTCPTQKFTALTWTLQVLKGSWTHTSTEPSLLPWTMGTSFS